MPALEPRDLGGLFMIGLFDTSFDAEAREFLDELKPAGVILFTRNVIDPVQIALLNHDLQAYAHRRYGEGLLIGTDQEGGRVSRLRAPFTQFPPALEIAESDDPEGNVERFATVTARELRLTGFTTDFIPVMDVLGGHGDARSSVIGDRSYGADPRVAANLGTRVATVLQSMGITACAKHFPGHGGTSVDSHLDLPVDHRSRERIERSDLVPFRAAVAAGVSMIMSAHVVYPAIDPERPATLSRAALTGILREEIGFDGVTVSDDMDMAAVSDRYGPEEYSAAAIDAGADLVLICNDPQKSFAARMGLVAALRDRTLTEERIRLSLERLARLKRTYADSLAPCDIQAVRDYFSL